MVGFGETLRQARAHKGVSLKEAEQATRITRHYLAALEEEDFASLPPVIYQRGFVRNYSLYLGLDPTRTMELFEQAHGNGARPAASSVAAVPPIDMPSHWAPNFAIIAFSVVLSAIVFAWVYTAYVAPPGDESEATPPIPTVTQFPQQDIVLPTKAAPTSTSEATAPADGAAPSATAEATRDGSGGDNQIGAASGDEAAQPTEESSDDSGSGGGDNARGASNDEQDEPTEEPAPTDEPEPTEEPEPTAYVKTGEYDTTIEVVATGDIYVTFWANGEVVFDGSLAAGDTTGAFPGSTFEVYTSNTAATEFINGCGDQFFLSPNDGGEYTYPLNAGADSCPYVPSEDDD
jgi:cytoskeletal protein RodZ